MLMVRTKTRHGKKTDRPPARARRSAADAERLRAIRKAHGWSQQDLARKIGVKQPLVAAWEKGHGPSPRMYFALSRIVLDYESQQWLLKQAGADLQTIEVVADGLLKRRGASPIGKEIVRIMPISAGDLLYPARWAAHSVFRAHATLLMDGIEEPEGPELIVSREMMPPTTRLRYVTVRDNFMAPQFRRGDRLVIDYSETDPWNIQEGACVVAYRSARYAAPLAELQRKMEVENPEEADRRKRSGESPFDRVGLFAGWLRKQIEPDATGVAPLGAVKGSPPRTMLGFFSLEAPWLPTRVGILGIGPEHPADVPKMSDHLVLGRAVAWISRSDARSQGRDRASTR